jgi:hypothetical protein
VAVEKVGFPEKSQKSGDRKCLGNSGKSFVELPDAIQLFQIPSERVFQQPPLFSTPIRKHVSANDRSAHIFYPSERDNLVVLTLTSGDSQGQIAQFCQTDRMLV